MGRALLCLRISCICLRQLAQLSNPIKGLIGFDWPLCIALSNGSSSGRTFTPQSPRVI